MSAPRRLPRPLPAAHDLLDVVHQAEEIPLRAHLGLAPEREAAHAHVVPAWVPLRSLLALAGSFTPSMANMALPIRPMRSQVTSTWANRAYTSGPSSRTNLAMWE